MHKLEFTLRQHTPLIHFQHDQEGATLRATEVKPKLDRFILERLGNGSYEDGLDVARKKEWMIGKQNTSESLNYKIDFEGIDEEDFSLKTSQKEVWNETEKKKVKVWKTEDYPLLLANMGGKITKQELKNFVVYETVNSSIITFESKLLETIKRDLPLFFFKNNFGNRQNKGFGSFYLDEKDSLYQDPLKLQNTNYYQYQKAPHKDDIMNDINVIYKIMKSGYNFPDHPIRMANGKKELDYDEKGKFAMYVRSFLSLYIEKYHRVGNEKKFIKETFFKRDVRIDKDSVEKFYVRSLLGITDFIEFRDKQRRGKIIFKSKNENIERYPSPVTFKPIGCYVFIYIIAIPLPITTFELSDGYSKIDLQTPHFRFDYTDFIKKFISYIDVDVKKELERLITLKNINDASKPVLDFVNCLENITFTTT